MNLAVEPRVRESIHFLTKGSNDEKTPLDPGQRHIVGPAQLELGPTSCPGCARSTSRCASACSGTGQRLPQQPQCCAQGRKEKQKTQEEESQKSQSFLIKAPLGAFCIWPSQAWGYGEAAEPRAKPANKVAAIQWLRLKALKQSARARQRISL